MEIEKYITKVEISKKGLFVKLTDGSRHLLNDEMSKIVIEQYIKENLEPKSKTFEGWFGGEWDDMGFYDDKEDAERGMIPPLGQELNELLNEFKGKKIRMTIVEII